MRSALRISDDRLQAVLDLPAGLAVAAEELEMLIEAAGVRQGLCSGMLQAALLPEAGERHLVVACGRPAEPPQPARFEPPLDLASLPRQVTAGAEIGRFIPGRPGVPGAAVDGRPIPPPAECSMMLALRLGRGIDVAGNGSAIANRDGLLMRDADGTLRVALCGVAERERTDILVRIEIRALQAWITLQAGEFVSPATLRTSLERAKVTFGIDPGAIAEAGRATTKRRNLLVAQGQQAVDGSAAWVEHLIDDRGVPTLEQFDTLDFNELSRLREVDIATPLLCLVPPTPGRPGTNIFGNPLPARAGSSINIACFISDGTRQCPDDALVVESTRKGVCRRDSVGRVQVQEQLVVEGDVDHTVGDIDTTRPVVIMGDIKKGFRVKSACDITVHGCIEDARVTAQGNLLVKGGILSGEARVKAHGDLTAHSISGREVKARSLAVLTIARSCLIKATDEVTVRDLAGCHVVAAKGVRCERLGSDAALATRIEVGLDPYRLSQEHRAEQDRQALEQQAATLKERCSQAAHRMNAHALDARSIELANELRRLVGEYRQIMKRLAEVRELIRRKHERSSRPSPPITATIEVRGTAFPGVALIFGQLTHVLDRPLRRPRFVLKDGRLTW